MDKDNHAIPLGRYRGRGDVGHLQQGEVYLSGGVWSGEFN